MVFAGEKLTVHVGHMPPGGDRGTRVIEHLSQYEMIGWFADEQAAHSSVAQRRVPIGHRIAARRDAVGGTGLIEPPLGDSDWKHAAVRREIGAE